VKRLTAEEQDDQDPGDKSEGAEDGGNAQDSEADLGFDGEDGRSNPAQTSVVGTAIVKIAKDLVAYAAEGDGRV
jgi:hypothetical protein